MKDQGKLTSSLEAFKATKNKEEKGKECKWGRGPHVFLGEAGFRVVLGLVARPTYYITSWLPLLYLYGGLH